MRLGVLLLSFSIIATIAPVSSAQSLRGAVVTGTVADETGATLPGVTVTGRSPALQLPTITTVTSADGAYEFRDLPPGTYEFRYELSGFQVFTRSELRLNAGFTARIDAALKVGQIEENVTVTGQSPVVDILGYYAPEDWAAGSRLPFLDQD